MAVASQRDGDLPAVQRELDGVRQQVPDHLLESVGVSGHPTGVRRLRLTDLDLLERRRHRGSLDHLADDGGEVHELAVDPELAVRRASRIDEIVDQRRLVPGASGDVPHGALAEDCVHLRSLQDVEPHQHGAERRPKLVRDHRQELLLHGAGGFSGRARFAFQAKELGALLGVRLADRDVHRGDVADRNALQRIDERRQHQIDDPCRASRRHAHLTLGRHVGREAPCQDRVEGPATVRQDEYAKVLPDDGVRCRRQETPCAQVGIPDPAAGIERQVGNRRAIIKLRIASA